MFDKNKIFSQTLCYFGSVSPSDMQKKTLVKKYVLSYIWWGVKDNGQAKIFS